MVESVERERREEDTIPRVHARYGGGGGKRRRDHEGRRTEGERARDGVRPGERIREKEKQAERKTENEGRQASGQSATPSVLLAIRALDETRGPFAAGSPAHAGPADL